MRSKRFHSRMARNFAPTCFVFACGPWMGKLFPQTIGANLQATKQDVFFFGTPAGDRRFNEDQLPVWADHRPALHVWDSGQSRSRLQDCRRHIADPHSIPQMANGELATPACKGTRVRAAALSALERAPLVKPASANMSRRQTATSSSIAILQQHRSGWWVGARVTASSTVRRWESSSPKLVLKDADTNPRWAHQAFLEKSLRRACSVQRRALGLLVRKLLLDLNHAVPGVRPDLIHTRHDSSREFIQSLRMRGILTIKHGWLPSIPTFA